MTSSSSDSRDHGAVSVIDREQLRAKLAIATTHPFKLLMAASDFGFRAKRIPGSLHVKPSGDSFATLGQHDDIVVYCSNLDCHASKAVIDKLVERGYDRVSHYAGGLIDWETAGLALEGDWATSPTTPTPTA